MLYSFQLKGITCKELVILWKQNLNVSHRHMERYKQIFVEPLCELLIRLSQHSINSGGNPFQLFAPRLEIANCQK